MSKPSLCPSEDRLTWPLPATWERVPLGAVVPKAEYGISTSLDTEGRLPVLRMNNLAGGEAELSDLKFTDVPVPSELLLKPDDVLFNRTNSMEHVGRTGIWRGQIERATFASYLVRLVPDRKRLTPAFLNKWLNFPPTQTKVRRWATPAVQQVNINPTNLRKTLIDLPPVHEQARIAEVLDALDEAIRSVQMVLNKKNTALIGLLRSLFSPSGGGQVPTHRTALGDYPSTWEVVPLRECVRPDTIITYGIVQAGPHVPDGVPYIRTGDMSGDALTVEGLLRTATRIDQAYARSKVRTGEIVCAIRATVGKVLPVPPELDGANLTQGTARIAPAQDINPSFLLWAIRSPWVQREIGLTVKGTTFAEITLEALREIPIPRPRDREEQNKIAATLDGLEAEIRREQAQLAKLQTIKTGLTADLLTGRIRCSEISN